MKSILKYLRRTKDVFLVFGGEDELSVRGYTDASFQTDKDDSRLQLGFVFCLNGGGSELEKFQARDSSRFDDRVRVYCTSEAAKVVWIGKFVSVLGVVPSASSPVDFYCDNSGAIAQAEEPRSHQNFKHILWRYHLIHEIIDRGYVNICKVHTDLNIANPLTKPLPQPKHEAHPKAMGIRYLCP